MSGAKSYCGPDSIQRIADDHFDQGVIHGLSSCMKTNENVTTLETVLFSDLQGSQWAYCIDWVQMLPTKDRIWAIPIKDTNIWYAAFLEFSEWRIQCYTSVRSAETEERCQYINHVSYKTHVCFERILTSSVRL